LGAIIESIVLGKFSERTREEVQAMLNLDFNVKQTKIYQEAIQEGRQEGEEIGIKKGRQVGRQEGRAKALEEERQKIGRHVMETLTAKFGTLPDIWMETIRTAPSDKILDLYGKAMAAQRLEDVAL